MEHYGFCGTFDLRTLHLDLFEIGPVVPHFLSGIVELALLPLNVEVYSTEVVILWQRLNLFLCLHSYRRYLWKRACSLLVVEAES